MKKKSVKMSSMRGILALLQQLQINALEKFVCTVDLYVFDDGDSVIRCFVSDTDSYSDVGKSFAFHSFEKSEWHDTYKELLDFINTQINNGKD